MSIVLRTNKGSALTYDEMDRNQSQFFYSSSKSPDGLKLRLHYTGSDNLDTTEDYGPTRYHEVSFPLFESEQPDSNVAGDNFQIQFNENNNFGARSIFVFNYTNNSVGIGTTTPLQRLDIVGNGARGGNIALRGSVNHEGEIQSLAGIKFYKGNTDATLLGKVGRLEYVNSAYADDIFIHSGDHDNSSGFSADDDKQSKSFHISLGTTTPSITPANRIGATFIRSGNSKIKVGINNTNPTLNLSVVGSNGIGVSHTNTTTDDHSRIKPSDPSSGNNNSYFNQTSLGVRTLLPDNSTAEGLEISSPSTNDGGNILMVINTDDNKKEGFNIITAQRGSAPTGEILATFQASGKVGIGTNFPDHTGLTIQDDLSIKGLGTGTSVNTKTLVATSTGLVKQIAAAPVPLGGIIMWSGTTAPAGWRICEDGVGTVNGVQVPNLTDKFIMGAGDTYNPGDTGGSTSFTPEGIINLDKLGIRDLPPHHHFFLGDDRLYNRIPTGTLSGINSIERVGGPGTYSSNDQPVGQQGLRQVLGYDAGSSNSSNEDRRLYATSHNNADNNNTSSGVMDTNLQTVPTGTFTGTVAPNAIIPPFYALAYIIYVGV